MSTPRKTATGSEICVSATVDGRKRRRRVRSRTRAEVLREADARRTAWYVKGH